MLIAGLSTGHKAGLLVVAGVFIGFALFSSLIAPRKWSDFPGRQGMSVYIIVCLVLFAAMVTAVVVFGAESESAPAALRTAAAAMRGAA